MGIYLNPGYENFRRTLAADIYVDKTMMIAETNRFIDKGNNYICISRPRRFGKTIAGNMLSAYYSKGCDARALFAPYRIAKYPCFEEKLNKYNVIKIDMNSEYQNTRDKSMLIHRLEEAVKKEMREQFPGLTFAEDDSLADCIQNIFHKTGETFIILIDEYDVLVREQVAQALFDEFLSFLNGLFKSDTLRPAISLAYLTGILPVIRDRIQSKLNNFEEYTILNARELAEFVGFTTEEVKDLCEAWHVDFEECCRWYDGYLLEKKPEGFGEDPAFYEIYNPESVVKAVINRKLGSYWGKTSTYEVISDYVSRNFDGTKDAVLKMISGESVEVDPDKYRNTMSDFKSMDDVFTYLMHVGYLAYNSVGHTCRIPNKEVRDEWLRAVSIMEDYKETDRIIKDSRELLAETIAGNEEAVAKALDRSHIHVTSNRSYNNEDALQSAIYLAYIFALNRYTVVKEMTAGRGFSDVTFIPFVKDYPAMIIELKKNDSAASAIDQIRDKQYYESLSHYQGDLLFVGVNYDEKEKTHSCKIERFELATFEATK
ncbi:MAG: AAA family ATPase [Lachnospiraceae bacterium]|nr:AAA family ATPase [Lachnospiraceae bacterium]